MPDFLYGLWGFGPRSSSLHGKDFYPVNYRPITLLLFEFKVGKII